MTLSGSFASERRLSLYLGLIAVFVALVPMSLIYILVSRNATETLSTTLSTGLMEKAVLVSRGVDRFYHQRLIDVLHISQADVLESNRLPAIARYFSEIERDNPHLTRVRITQLDGSILAQSSGPDERGQYIQKLYPSIEQDVRLAARGAQGDVFISGLVDIGNGSKGVIFITPVTDDSNTDVIKLLIMETNLDLVTAILSELNEYEDHVQHRVYIVDNDGHVITSTEPGVSSLDLFPDFKANPALIDRFAAQSDVGSLVYRDAHGVEVMAGYADMAEFGTHDALDWNIIATAPLDLITRPATRLNARIAAATLITGVAIFMTMFFLGRQVIRVVWSQANYDPLTHLPNRRLFTDRLKQHIKITRRTGATTALLFIDLDHFKEINDSLGHHVGDELLLMAAERISNCVRAVDTVSRIGGDEFAVILTEVANIHSIERIARDILCMLDKPLELHNEVLHISASIGITLCPQDGDTVPQLLTNADQAMYLSKREGRRRFSYYTGSMQDAAKKRLRLANDLRNALRNNQLELHYQPIIDPADNTIGKAEALLRWQHPLLGTIQPAEFIPIAEETTLISEIGDWVFQEVIRQVKIWRQRYNANFQISFNASPIQFRSAKLYKKWLACLYAADLPGESIVIEITEGVLMGHDPTINRQLLHFRDAGIQVAIDDFGTGYSALSYLNKFDIDYLKIDKSFVDGIARGSDDLLLSEAIIAMAHKLGLKVIAEGVETRQQCQLLAEVGCDYCQGYLYANPLAVCEFEALLHRSTPPPSNIRLVSHQTRP